MEVLIVLAVNVAIAAFGYCAVTIWGSISN
jgi:hypothetical protein